MQLFKAIACINPLRFVALIFCGWKVRKLLTITPDLLFLCFAVEAKFKDGPKSFTPGCYSNDYVTLYGKREIIWLGLISSHQPLKSRDFFFFLSLTRVKEIQSMGTQGTIARWKIEVRRRMTSKSRAWSLADSQKEKT